MQIVNHYFKTNLSDYSTSKSDFDSNFVKLQNTVIKLDFTLRSRITLNYLIFFGRYPVENEYLDAEVAYISLDASELIHWHNQMAAKKEQKNVVLSFISDRACLVDVTSTCNLNYNSGIQRVVRKFSEYAHDQGLVEFVNFDNVLMPTLLNDGQKSLLLHWSADNRKGNLKKGYFRRITKGRVLKLILYPYFIVSRLIYITVDYLKWGKTYDQNFLHKFWDFYKNFLSSLDMSSKTSSHREVVCLLNQKLFLPEIIEREQHVDLLVNLKKSGFLRELNVLVYDLIPISHPEFFVTELRSLFVRYLTLLKHANKVSCISHSVKQKVTTYLNLICDKNDVQPKVEAHHLGCNLEDSNLSSNQKILSDDSQKPLVICVGTIEPRKNGIRILRAVVKAMKAGHKFTFVFAGNKGWKSEYFMKEFNFYKGQSLDIHMRSGLSDTEIKKLYKQSQFSVFCSQEEGFGLPIVESLFYGKPCLTSNVSSMSELAEMYGGCLTVNPFSEEDIKSGLVTLIENKELFKKLNSEAQDFKIKTWNEYGKELTDFLVS